jgi:predicted Rossmann fold nucleotide-binding protein DprA/Smf involved in DNA uptake
MKYGIVGSRRRKDKETVVAFVNELQKDDVVVTGGCRGVDTWAAEAAAARSLRTRTIRPDTSKCRTRFEVADAYYDRNRRVAEESDMLVAFVASDRRGGTENTIAHARRLGKPVRIVEEK